MQDSPHRYVATASALEGEPASIRGSDLPEIISDTPVQFGGPGGHWSPEELLMAAVADSFVLNFRDAAQADAFAWRAIECRAEGVLAQAEHTTQFTSIILAVELMVGAEADRARAAELLNTAAEASLIIRTLSAGTELVTEIAVAE